MVRVFSIVLAFILSGCYAHTSVCPDFPTPTQEVLNNIKSLNNSEVDNWIIKLYKLNQKLKVCKGD